MTGQNPGRHGIFFFAERIPGSYQRRFVNGSMREGVAFWRLLGEVGRRVGIMNVPMTFPAEPVNGFLISGMDAPDVEHPQYAYPPTLISRLRTEVGGFISSGLMSAVIGQDVLAGRIEQAIQTLLQRIETRTRWAEYLVRSEQPDLMVVVHTETDGAQHFFWKFMDPRHPEYSPTLAQRYGDAIRRVYQKADEAIDRLMACFGDGIVLVLSDHGAGLGNEFHQVVRRVLRELGLLVYEGEGIEQRGLRRSLSSTLYRWMNPRLPLPMRRRLRHHLPGVVEKVKADAMGRIDWSRTKAYATGAQGEIWLNVRGREPAGKVEPGREFEGLRQFIAEAFRSCIDIDTGGPVVEAVLMREDMYHGPYESKAPDLFVRPADGLARGFRLGTREVVFPRRRPSTPREAMSGGHRPDGVVILYGPNVQRGAAISSARLEDIAPTVLYACGVALPRELDGAVLRDAFTSDFLAAHPVTFTSAHAAEPRLNHDFTQEEAAVVQRRLENLGYL